MSITNRSGDASRDDDGRFSKRFEFEKADDNEQIAYGAVLVPDRLDHQGDFLRADTIASLREEFEERVEDGDAYGGVMHTVFPDDDVELVEDRQLEAAETLGDKELPAGTWVQGWQFTDDDLWQLVKDGVLGGNSIGGTAKGRRYDPGAMPDDVEIPDPVQAELDEAGLSRDDIMVREITDGRIMEVSSVDYPAVPDATHEEHKSLATAKAASALTENVVAARLYLESRGHDPDDARRLAEYLNDQKSQKGLFGRLREKWLPGGSTSAASKRSGQSDAQHSDERAESRAGSDDFPTNMDADELNEKLDGIDSRLDEIDAKIAPSEGGSEGEEKTDGGDGDGDGPSTEEKLDMLADATQSTVERVDEIAEQVERMADAQGASQQADQGSSGEAGGEKLWGDSSPFGGDA
jgi:hypothetical protein